MNCGDFEVLIALEVAGDLPAAEAAPVQRHLNECEPCRSFAAELAADLQWLQSAHQEPPDSAALHQVRVGVMRRLESEQRRWDRPFGGLTTLGWRWHWIAAAAAIAIFGVLAWWGASLDRPAVVAVDAGMESGAPESGDRNSQRAEDRPEATESQTNQKPEPNLAKGGVQSETQTAPAKSASPAGSSPLTPRVAAGGETVQPGPKNRQPLRRSSQHEVTSAPQLASLDPAVSAPTGALQHGVGRLENESQAEIVTALLNEPLEQPTEVVMLKIPTSNPDIVVYWVMDEEKPPQADVENQGD
jgi:hypothetical protein